MPITIEQSNEEVIRGEALAVIERAKIVRIVDQPSYDLAADLLLTSIKPLRKKWRDFWYGGATDPGPIPLAHKAYKAVLDKFNQADGPLESAENQVKAEINRFDQEQERKRQELQREAEAEACRAEQEARAREAAVAADFGASDDEVEAIMSQPQTVVAPPVEPTYQRASGVSTRENWQALVLDMKKLCAAVAKGQVPLTYVLPNESALNARARADKGTMNVPGVTAVNNPVISGRSTR